MPGRVFLCSCKVIMIFWNLFRRCVIPANITDVYVLQVTAKDEDEGANGEVTYRLISIQPPAEPPLLSIDPMSGRISLVHAVPSDWAGRRLRAIVRATDGGQRSTDALFEVDLAGRLGPRFTETHYTAVVREDVDLGHAVTTLEAYSASENTLLYRVVEVEEEGVLVRCPFVLDYKTGK